MELEDSHTSPLVLFEGPWAVRSMPTPSLLSPKKLFPSSFSPHYTDSFHRTIKFRNHQMRSSLNLIFKNTPFLPLGIYVMLSPKPSQHILLCASGSCELFLGKHPFREEDANFPFWQTHSVWEQFPWICEDGGSISSSSTTPGRRQKRLSHHKHSAMPWILLPLQCSPYVGLWVEWRVWQQNFFYSLGFLLPIPEHQENSNSTSPLLLLISERHSPTGTLSSPRLIFALVHWLSSVCHLTLSFHRCEPPCALRKWWNDDECGRGKKQASTWNGRAGLEVREVNKAHHWGTVPLIFTHKHTLVFSRAFIMFNMVMDGMQE